jgi:hypothetical protein
MEEVAALAEVSKIGFQECFQKLYERWQKCVTVQGNHFEGNVEIEVILFTCIYS